LYAIFLYVLRLGLPGTLHRKVHSFSISLLLAPFIPFLSKYTEFMGRNHFSQQGGPYFINDGFSKHVPHHAHEEVKSSNRIYGLLAALAILGPVALTLFIVANL
jgi:hypothetical protein